MRNLLKLVVLIIVASCSLNTASNIINDMVIEVNQREKTIADALIQQQVQEMFQAADKEIAKVQEEEQVTIQVEEVEIKPPLPKKEETPKKEEQSEEQEQVSEQEIEIVQEVGEEEDSRLSIDVATDRTLDLANYSTLTAEDIKFVGNYLIDHYFLFGQEYYEQEQNPIRYERKKLASDMEDRVIDSLKRVFSLVTDLSSLNKESINNIKDEATTYAQTFKEQFKNVGEQGTEFTGIYESGNAFFETYIKILEKGEETFTLLEQTTNKALVLPILLKQLNDSLLPGIKDILNQGFAFKEQTNKIYIEGIDASFLITPDEVMDIIENPYRILPSKPKPPTGEGQESEVSADGSIQSSTEQTTDSDTKQEVETSTDLGTEEGPETSADQSTEGAEMSAGERTEEDIETSADQGTEEAGEMSSDQSTEEAGEISSDQSTEEAGEISSDQSTEEDTEISSDQSTEENIEMSAEESNEEDVATSTEQSIESKIQK